MGEAALAERDEGLVRALGPLGLAATVFNATVGAGIFVLPAALARAVGAAAPLAYLACLAAMGAVALCFAAGGSRVPVSGGPAGVVQAAFGPFAGFVAGVLVWLGAVLAAAGVARAVVEAAAQAAPAPLHAALGSPPGRDGAIVLLLALLAGVNAAGVRPGARLVSVLTLAKLLPLAALVAATLPRAHPASLAFHPPHPGALGRAMILALFAFQGMETALGVSGEVRQPARTVPRALLIALGAVAVLYLAVQASVQGVLGPALAGSKAPLVDAAATVSPALAGLVALRAAVSMLGYLSGDALSAPRLLFAFAREGLLPRVVGALHPRSRAPYAAIGLHLGLAAALAFTGGFVELVTLASLTSVLLYALACLAAVRLQHRGVALAGPPLRVAGLPLAAAVGVAAMGWIALNARPAEALGLLGALGLSAAWYAAARGLRRLGGQRPRHG